MAANDCSSYRNVTVKVRRSGDWCMWDFNRLQFDLAECVNCDFNYV